MDGPKVKPARMHIADDFFDHHFCFQRLSVVFRTWPWRGRPYVEAMRAQFGRKAFAGARMHRQHKEPDLVQNGLLILHSFMVRSGDQPILPFNFSE